MAILNFNDVTRIIGDINLSDEEDRRQTFRRRGRIYKDGGKDFLIEYLTQEFGKQALNEMRLAPVNVLKSWVDRKSIIYARPPVRKADEESDQVLMDEYVERTGFNMLMQKANRYFNLYSNTEPYVLPRQNMDGTMEPFMRVMPPWLYSVSVKPLDPTEKDAIIFSSFTSKDQSLQRKEVVEVSKIKQESGSRTNMKGESIDSRQASIGSEEIPYIFWTDEQHFTVFQGEIVFNEANPDNLNPIGIMPAVTLRKDVDNEFWAMQGEDMVDMALATQLMYTDQLTIAKQQGFALLVVTATEPPTKLDVGLQKGVFLKQKEGEPTPTIQYVTANAPIDQYSNLSREVLGVSSSSNLLSANMFSGGSNDPNSGVQEMIRNASTLMEIESQKPILRDAEMEIWERFKRWHNLLHDRNELPEDLRALGKFSEEFAPQIMYQDMKPVESEENRITQVKSLIDMGLISKKDAFKKLNPELKDEEIQMKMEEIEEEKQARAAAFGLPGMGIQSSTDPSQDDEEEEDVAEDEDKDGEEDQV